jgi:hypothetical protein
MEKKKVAIPLVCHGHSRPVVDLFYSPVTPDGYFLISASKGNPSSLCFSSVWCGSGAFECDAMHGCRLCGFSASY